MTPNQPQANADDGLGAILLAARSSRSGTVHGATEAVTATAVRVRLPRDLGDPHLGAAHRSPRELTAWVRRRLGEGARLGVVAGSHTAWCGAVRLVGVELTEESDQDFAAVFALEHPLSVADQRALGLEVVEAERNFESMRGAERVPVEMPVEVLTLQGAVVGTVKDLSSTGLRVHLRADDLGFPPTADMSELARGLGSKLGTRFEVNLNHAVLGNLLAQSVQMTRLCAVNGQEGIVELGGRFLRPLAADAAAVLGVALPAPGESTEQATARGAPPAPTKRVVDLHAPAPPAPTPEPDSPDLDAALGPSSRRTLRAQISCKAAGAPPATTCQTETVGMRGVVVRMARSNVGGVTRGETNILQLSRRFTEVFGDEVTLKLHDGPIHLWSGPARVIAMHLPPDKPGAMLVTFGYARDLSPSEITRLGLARLAG